MTHSQPINKQKQKSIPLLLTHDKIELSDFCKKKQKLSKQVLCHHSKWYKKGCERILFCSHWKPLEIINISHTNCIMQDMNNKIRGSYKTKAYLERLFWGVIFFSVLSSKHLNWILHLFSIFEASFNLFFHNWKILIDSTGKDELSIGNQQTTVNKTKCTQTVNTTSVLLH